MDPFERRFKKLMEMFERMLNKMGPPRRGGEGLWGDLEESDLGPGIDVRIGVIDGNRGRIFTLGPDSSGRKVEEAEDEGEEDDPQELALKRFEERRRKEEEK